MRVRLHKHPFSEAEPEVFEAESLAHWLLDRYEGRNRPNLQIYAGEPHGSTLVPLECDAILGCSAEVCTVLETPGADPITFLIQFAIATAINVTLNYLFAPSRNALENHDQESPNNQLSDRQNRVRMMERVPEIYGTVKSIPDLLMQTYFKWVNHRRVEYGYYCITRGYADVTDVRDGDTLLSEIAGAGAKIYAPFTSPNSGSPQSTIGDVSGLIDKVVTVGRSSSVEALVLKAANQLTLMTPSSLHFRGPGSAGVLIGLPTTTLDVLFQPESQRRPNFAAVSEVGQELMITMSDLVFAKTAVVGMTVTVDAATKTYSVSEPGLFRGVVDATTVTVSSVGGLFDPANLGPKTVVSHTDSSITVAESLVDESAVLDDADTVTWDAVVNYSGTRIIAEVFPNYITLEGTPQYPSLPEQHTVAISVDNGLTDWTDWFVLPAPDRTEVWTNIVALSGMYKDDGAKSGTSVAYEVQIEQLDGSLTPTGVIETVPGSISGATSNERAETLERVTAWTGPARVRARRTTPFDFDFNGLVVDEIKWMDLYSVTPVTKAHFGNKTTIHTVMSTNAGSAALRRRELNCLGARKLPTFNGTTFSGVFDSTGLLVSGTISATNKIVDIIAAIAADARIGNRNVNTDLDMAQIWATQQALDSWHAQCGQFNYTFDTDSISFEETVQAVANAAFCVAYRQNGKIRLALDRPQANSVAMFSHRNKKPKAETITRKFASDSEYDGIELVYVDPETEQRETIRLPLDGSATREKKVETVGIRSYEQAWFRANREYRRLIGQRLSIETEATSDARALFPNARISVVDNTRFKAYDGEVIAQDGLTLTLSRDVAFVPATPHSIILQKRDGSLQSITCTEVVGASDKVLLASPPAEAVVTTETNEDGIRTTFSFAADSARAAQLWLVQELAATEGGYVRIRGVNYDPNYYAADEAAIPAKAGVIND